MKSWPEQRERGPSEGYFTTPAVTLVTSHSMATLKNPMKSSKLPQFQNKKETVNKSVKASEES